MVMVADVSTGSYVTSETEFYGYSDRYWPREACSRRYTGCRLLRGVRLRRRSVEGDHRTRAVPFVGVIEVVTRNQPTRFVPITDRRKLAGALLVGIDAFGMWSGLACRRR